MDKSDEKSIQIKSVEYESNLPRFIYELCEKE